MNYVSTLRTAHPDRKHTTELRSVNRMWTDTIYIVFNLQQVNGIETAFQYHRQVKGV